MDQVSEFLTSPDGLLVEHAIVVLLVVGLGYLTEVIRRRTYSLERKLDDHIKSVRLPDDHD